MRRWVEAPRRTLPGPWPAHWGVAARAGAAFSAWGRVRAEAPAAASPPSLGRRRRLLPGPTRVRAGGGAGGPGGRGSTELEQVPPADTGVDEGLGRGRGRAKRQREISLRRLRGE